MQTESVDTLDQIELQLLEDYQRIMNVLQLMKANVDPIESSRNSNKFEIEYLKHDLRDCSANVKLASSNLNEVCQNLKHNQERVLRIIGELPETLVNLPYGKLNKNVYKDSLMQNIKENLEQLQK